MSSSNQSSTQEERKRKEERQRLRKRLREFLKHNDWTGVTEDYSPSNEDQQLAEYFAEDMGSDGSCGPPSINKMIIEADDTHDDPLEVLIIGTSTGGKFFLDFIHSNMYIILQLLKIRHRHSHHYIIYIIFPTVIPGEHDGDGYVTAFFNAKDEMHLHEIYEY